MGLSENVGLIFPMIASHFSWRDNDQQNHWVPWGLANIFSNTPIWFSETNMKWIPTWKIVYWSWLILWLMLVDIGFRRPTNMNQYQPTSTNINHDFWIASNCINTITMSMRGLDNDLRLVMIQSMLNVYLLNYTNYTDINTISIF